MCTMSLKLIEKLTSTNVVTPQISSFILSSFVVFETSQKSLTSHHWTNVCKSYNSFEILDGVSKTYEFAMSDQSEILRMIS